MNAHTIGHNSIPFNNLNYAVVIYEAGPKSMKHRGCEIHSATVGKPCREDMDIYRPKAGDNPVQDKIYDLIDPAKTIKPCQIIHHLQNGSLAKGKATLL
jgi:hypothetical protein